MFLGQGRVDSDFPHFLLTPPPFSKELVSMMITVIFFLFPGIFGWGEDSIFCFPCFSFWRFDLLQVASSSSSSLRHAFIIQAFYFRFFADFFLLRFENEVNEYYHYL